jgi:hypothetical protein
MKQVEIIVARDFSKTPIGRFESDGPFSAEVFRKTLLIPAFANYDVVTVVLDGVYGYGSSFLEEAFGGLIREGFLKQDLTSRLNLISDDDKFLCDEILSYINDSR